MKLHVTKLSVFRRNWQHCVNPSTHTDLLGWDLLPFQHVPSSFLSKPQSKLLYFVWDLKQPVVHWFHIKGFCAGDCAFVQLLRAGHPSSCKALGGARGVSIPAPYKGRGVMLGLWGLTEELDEADQIGRDSQTGGKAFIPLALWLGTGTWTPDRCLWKCPPPVCGSSGWHVCCVLGSVSGAQSEPRDSSPVLHQLSLLKYLIFCSPYFKRRLK